MSTVTDIGPAPAVDGAAVAPRHRRRRVVAVLLALGALLAVAAGASAVGLYAWDAGYEGRVLPGVRVGSVDVSGMTRDEAVAAVTAAYPFGDGRLVLRTPDGDVAIPYEDVDRGPNADELVDTALATGRDGDLVSRTIGEVRLALEGTTLPAASVRLDETALATRITEAVDALQRYPGERDDRDDEEGRRHRPRPERARSRPGAGRSRRPRRRFAIPPRARRRSSRSRPRPSARASRTRPCSRPGRRRCGWPARSVSGRRPAPGPSRRPRSGPGSGSRPPPMARSWRCSTSPRSP